MGKFDPWQFEWFVGADFEPDEREFLIEHAQQIRGYLDLMQQQKDNPGPPYWLDHFNTARILMGEADAVYQRARQRCVKRWHSVHEGETTEELLANQLRAVEAAAGPISRHAAK